MKKTITLLLILVVCLSLCACGSNTNDVSEPQGSDQSSETVAAPVETPASEEKTEDLYIGTWEWKDFDEQGPSNGVTHMELYAGGTGKGTNSTHKGTDSYYPITWEINGDVINITASNTPKVGMKLEDGKLVSVDGSFSYTRVD